MPPGVRVVRGPNWKWGDQDGGEGHVGTVVRPGHAENGLVHNGTVFVQWDNGQLANYRIGDCEEDLLVFDLGPAGTVRDQEKFTCDECLKENLIGFRWQCLDCGTYNLCDICYTTERHNLGHTFLRYNSLPGSDSFPVTVRVEARKVTALGLFPGATVVRGPDWKWADQDGGTDHPGLLLNVTDLKGARTVRSFCRVKWNNGHTNEYRIGQDGKIDLMVTVAAKGRSYYPAHLPTLTEAILNGDERVVAAGGAVDLAERDAADGNYSLGDRVQVNLDPDIFQMLQEGHGGWVDDLALCIGQDGEVKQRLATGDYMVQFKGLVRRPMRINGAALSRASRAFKRGDMVVICDDEDQLKSLQDGHGGYTEEMKSLVGAVCKVKGVDSDGDVRVRTSGHTWCVNASCCTLLTPEELQSLVHDSDESSSDDDSDISGLTGGMGQLLSRLIGAESRLSSLIPGFDGGVLAAIDPDNLVAAAANNHEEVVKAIIEKHPDKVDVRNQSRTALQMASIKGHTGVVRLLLAAGADVTAQDEDGDMPPHFAVIENRAEVLQILIEHGMDVNLVNFRGLTPLHIAVHKSHIQCVRVLVKSGCRLDCKDEHDDTALNDAIRLGNQEIVTLLMSDKISADYDFSARNANGFNMLHYAALKGNHQAVQLVLERAPQLIDVQMSDGHSALHIAACNGYTKLSETLIKQGKADLDLKNKKGKTALMIAAEYAQTPIIQLLVLNGCNVNMSDQISNSILHTVLTYWNTGGTTVPGTTTKSPARNMSEAHEIQMVEKALPADARNRSWLAVAAFLLVFGADISQLNWQRKAPIDIVDHPDVYDLLVELAKRGSSVVTQSVMATSGSSAPIASAAEIVEQAVAAVTAAAANRQSECLMCSDALASVIFLPCNHCIACEECASRIKRCFICKTVIVSKQPCKVDEECVKGIDNSDAAADNQEREQIYMRVT